MHRKAAFSLLELRLAESEQQTSAETPADSMCSFLSGCLLLCECALVWMQSSALLLCQHHTSTQKNGKWVGGRGVRGEGLQWSVSISISPDFKES